MEQTSDAGVQAYLTGGNVMQSILKNTLVENDTKKPSRQSYEPSKTSSSLLNLALQQSTEPEKKTVAQPVKQQTQPVSSQQTFKPSLLDDLFNNPHTSSKLPENLTIEQVKAMSPGMEQYRAALALAGSPYWQQAVKEYNAGKVEANGILDNYNAGKVEANGILDNYRQLTNSLASQNSPYWQQAVKEYNAGKKVNPIFQPLLTQLNGYYKQGQAAPGNLNPAIAAGAIKQWNIDSAPGGWDKFIDEVAPMVPTALGMYIGLPPIGMMAMGAMQGAFSNPDNPLLGAIRGGAGEYLAGTAGNWAGTKASTALNSKLAGSVASGAARGAVNTALSGAPITSILSQTLKGGVTGGVSGVTADFSPAIQGAAQGAAGALLGGRNIFEGAVRGGLPAEVSTLTGQAVSNIGGSPNISKTAGDVSSTAVNALLRGGNVTQSILRQVLSSGKQYLKPLHI